MGVYKVGNKWYLDYYVDGKRIREPASKNEKRAEKMLAAVIADIERGEYRFKTKHKISFEDFAEEYLGYLKVNKKSWSRNEASLKSLGPHFKEMLLSKITPGHIEKFKRKRLYEDKVQPSTINRDLGCLRHLFNIAKKLKCYDGENPVKDVDFFQERQLVMKILDREEIIRLINASKDYLKPIIIVALNTGMRRGELFNLRWNDIDFAEHFIFIKKSKSGFMRKIPMNDLVAVTLKNIKGESDFVFCSPKTKGLLTSVRTSFKGACKDARVPDLRFHDLRHTAATLMIMGGIDIVTVKEILGHSDIQMTMRYAHPTPENKRKAVNVLASIFESKKEEKPVIIWSQAEIEKALSHSLSDNND